MTILEHFELCTLVLGRNMAKFEEAVKMVNKEIVNPQLKQYSSLHGAKKYVLQELFLINTQVRTQKLTLLLNSSGTRKRDPFDQTLSRGCIGGSGNETIHVHVL